MSEILPDTLVEEIVLTFTVEDRGVGLAAAMLEAAARNNMVMMMTGPRPLDGTTDHFVIRPKIVEVKT